MIKRVVTVLVGILLVAPDAFAQQKTITGTVTTEQGAALARMSIVVEGTIASTSTTSQGSYTIRAQVGQVLQFRFIGTAPVERTVGDADVIDVQVRRVAMSLDAVVVTALGQTTTQRALGYSQQTVTGPDIAQKSKNLSRAWSAFRTSPLAEHPALGTCLLDAGATQTRRRRSFGQTAQQPSSRITTSLSRTPPRLRRIPSSGSIPR